MRTIVTSKTTKVKLSTKELKKIERPYVDKTGHEKYGAKITSTIMAASLKIVRMDPKRPDGHKVIPTPFYLILIIII